MRRDVPARAWGAAAAAPTPAPPRDKQATALSYSCCSTMSSAFDFCCFITTLRQWEAGGAARGRGNPAGLQGWGLVQLRAKASRDLTRVCVCHASSKPEPLLWALQRSLFGVMKLSTQLCFGFGAELRSWHVPEPPYQGAERRPLLEQSFSQRECGSFALCIC